MSAQRSESVYHNSGGGAGFFIFLVALALIVAPNFLGDMISGMSKIVLMGFGAFLFIVGTAIYTFTRLYRKTRSDEAFVRTGTQGRKVVMDGGAVVIPAMHNVTPVSLRSMRLEVKREGEQALITGNNLRADVHAYFLVRVDRNDESILAAASTLGATTLNEEALLQLIGEKLVSGLRSVAATMSLDELQRNREQFSAAVKEALREDLRHNGLTLESVPISHLDQTDPSRLKTDSNIFDAQGAAEIARIINEKKVERNKIEREADKIVKAQDVAKEQFVYDQEVSMEMAKAERDKKIEQARAASLVANQERDRTVELSQKEREKLVGVAEQERQQAEQTARVNREQALEVAERRKAIAVADAERERAEAEGRKLEAEAARQEQEQAVETVKVRAAAEREKNRIVIAEEAKAQSNKVAKNTDAEVAAYRTITEADAAKQAAEAQAAAQMRLAQAQLETKKLAAQGDEAVQMVPVNVSAKQVAVDQQRVEVLRNELEAKAAHTEVSAGLQIEITKIEANRDAAMAFAKALGEALSNANMTIWGDPSTVARVSQAFMMGQSNGAFLQGLSNATPPEVKEAVGEGLSSLASVGAGLLQKITGQTIDPAQVESALKSMQASKSGPNGPVTRT